LAAVGSAAVKSKPQNVAICLKFDALDAPEKEQKSLLHSQISPADFVDETTAHKEPIGSSLFPPVTDAFSREGHERSSASHELSVRDALHSPRTRKFGRKRGQYNAAIRRRRKQRWPPSLDGQDEARPRPFFPR
jgi:hypothetical protein